MERQPIFNVPGVVLALLALFVAVYALLAWLPEESADALTRLLAFAPARFDARSLDPPPGGELASITSLITHLFVHGNMPHLVFNSAWMLAFGTPVARRTDVLRFLAFFFVCGIAGALTFVLINGTGEAYIVGASGAISGLMGAAFRFLFAGLDLAAQPPATVEDELKAPAERLGDAMRTAPLWPLSQCLRDRRAVLAIAAWTAINLLLSVFGEAFSGGAGIAWEAHLGGFFVGLLTFGWFVRSPPVVPPSAEADAAGDAAGAS